MGDLLEPTGDIILGDGFADAGTDGIAAETEDDEADEGHQDQVEGEEGRVVETEDDHSDDGREDDIDAIKEEGRAAFLDGDDIEEAVDEFGGMGVVEGPSGNTGEAEGEVGGEPDEESALDDLGEVMLNRTDDGEEAQEGEQRERKDEERLDKDLLLAAEGDVVDDGIDGKWNGEVEDSCDGAEEDDGPDIGHLGPHQTDETTHRSWMGCWMCVGFPVPAGDCMARDRGADDSRVMAIERGNR